MKRKIIRCLYNSRFFRSRQRTVYKVYAICDNHCPELLKHKLRKVFVFPELGGFFVSREKHRKEAIQAYLDLCAHIKT